MLGKYAGHFDRSEELYNRALDILADGQDDDAIATIYHNLGGLAHARGKHDAGEKWARHAVEIRTSLHGVDDLLTLSDKSAWAALLEDCGRLDEARAILHECLNGFRKKLGPRDYEVAVTLHNLAAICHKKERWQLAESYYRESLEIKREVLGGDHPDCAVTLINLASLLARQCRVPSAKDRYREAVRILSGQVADTHPHLMAAQSGLDDMNKQPSCNCSG
ncbi:tetratricopeptide repeat protein [Streptomyces chartreusis]|uniref:tetratricopeptide repeat protein n=1 Tax=Streptomyces chartreusis TaxID=1969 RepID=UPI003687A103